MKLRVLSCALIAGLILSCQTGFNRGEMESSLGASNPSYVSSGLTVEKIEKLKPQIKLPIRLAVAPPTVSYHRWWGSRDLGIWSPEEIAEIELWEEPLATAGVLADLIVLPSSLVEQCSWDDPGCRVRAQRAAAATVQADALLLINLATAIDEYANPASVLNITIVGMWLAPGHHRDALTIAEGVMIDNRNEYLYAFARGEGETHTVRPLVYADTWKTVRSSRLKALAALREELVSQASQLSTR